MKNVVVGKTEVECLVSLPGENIEVRSWIAIHAIHKHGVDILMDIVALAICLRA